MNGGTGGRCNFEAVWPETLQTQQANMAPNVRIHDNILQTIGSTPMVRLNRIAADFDNFRARAARD